MRHALDHQAGVSVAGDHGLPARTFLEDAFFRVQP